MCEIKILIKFLEISLSVSLKYNENSSKLCSYFLIVCTECPCLVLSIFLFGRGSLQDSPLLLIDAAPAGFHQAKFGVLLNVLVALILFLFLPN